MAGTPRTIRTLAAVLTVPLLLLAAACGDDGGDGDDPFGVDVDDLDVDTNGDTDGDTGAPGGFEATPTYLRSVAETSSAEAYRFEMWMGFGGDADTSGPPIATGEQDGGRMSMRMDLGVLFDDIGTQMGEPLPPEIAGMDMTVEVMEDLASLDMYMRMPFLAEIAREFAPPGDPDADFFAAFADWVYIDAARLGDAELEDLESLMGDQNLDPAQLLEVLTDVEDARELEPIEVRGETMNGIAAEVTFEDMLAAQGVDLEAEIPGFTPNEEFRTLMDVTLDISVWVDSGGYLGRMSFAMDYSELLSIEGIEPGDLAEVEAALGGTSLTIVMDLFDYGDPGINIEFPADATDITDDIGRMSPGF